LWIAEHDGEPITTVKAHRASASLCDIDGYCLLCWWVSEAKSILGIEQ